VAAHVVGYVGARSGASTAIVAADAGPSGDEPAGRMGIERRSESLLRGQPGQERQFSDHRGKRLAATRQRKPAPGRDVVLTIDVALQISAEQLLDHCLRRLQQQSGQPGEVLRGGAIVVMDVHSGEILAAGSAPRFDPRAFAAGDARLEAVLHDPRRPLFDRVTKMAIPPGSVFKPLTALALLESARLDPQQVFRCQGYLDKPDHLRCQIFRQHGIGHGDVALADALAQSCNVYFFHHAGELGAAALLDWSGRLGLGRPSGIELPDEAAGQLPRLAQLRKNSQMQAFSIGQGPLTVTPLQIARMYAAIANGGYLIAPRMTRDRVDGRISREGDATATALSESDRIAALGPEALDAVRAGLRRVVEDPNGTAHDTARLASLSIAGKTGTAQTGGDQEDHAWFAGYVPAEAPRYAFVVVLEHAGSGATIAGSVAKSLVQRMQQLGYFGAPRTAENLLPPGKG
jgi:penicillin-binding protein 2